MSDALVDRHVLFADLNLWLAPRREKQTLLKWIHNQLGPELT